VRVYLFVISYFALIISSVKLVNNGNMLKSLILANQENTKQQSFKFVG